MKSPRIKNITSSNNPLIKNVKMLLTSSSARSKQGKTVIEGLTVCSLYVEKYGSPVICIMAEDVKSEISSSILSKLTDLGTDVLIVPRSVYSSFSNLDNGEGVCFVVEIPSGSELAGALNESALLIDRLQDPGNMGTIMRTAVAAGIKEVYCSNGTVSLWSPKVLRSAMGAHFKLNIYESVELKEVIDSSLVKVLATSSHSKSTIYQEDLNQKIAWLIGNEGRGVKQDLLEICDGTVAIPHKGEIESLNVSIATAICLFEHMRQSS